MIRRFQSAAALHNFLAESPDETDMHVIVGGNDLADISFPADSKLTKLTIGEPGMQTFLHRILSLPAGLQFLQISDCYNLESICDLPASLTSLFLARCKIRQLPVLPNGLVSLTLHDSPVLGIPHEFPESLTHVEIRRCKSIKGHLSQGIKIGKLTVCFEG